MGADGMSNAPALTLEPQTGHDGSTVPTPRHVQAHDKVQVQSCRSACQQHVVRARKEAPPLPPLPSIVLLRDSTPHGKARTIGVPVLHHHVRDAHVRPRGARRERRLHDGPRRQAARIADGGGERRAKHGQELRRKRNECDDQPITCIDPFTFDGRHERHERLAASNTTS